jgi:phage gp36-like protein
MAYATQEDVLRILGGTLDGVKAHFPADLWDGDYALADVTVNGNEFEVPETILSRIDTELANAQSRLEGYILQAYMGKPDEPVPLHLTQSCARLAAYNVLVDDGVKTDFITSLRDDTQSYMKDLAASKFDIAIEGERPNYRAPAAIVVRGVGGGGGRGRRGRCC